MNYSGAIFDLDGTLIDSNTVWEKLDRIILSRYDISCSDEFLHALASMTYEEAADAICSLGLKITAAQFADELNVLAVEEYANNISLKDGAEAYLHYLKENNIPICLATASPEMLYAPVLKNNKVYELFDAFVTTDEAGASKDFTDVYLAAADKINVPYSKCIVFEDVLKGILSAKKAGMTAVGVYDAFSPDEDAIKLNSHMYIHSFYEMIEKH